MLALEWASGSCPAVGLSASEERSVVVCPGAVSRAAAGGAVSTDAAFEVLSDPELESLPSRLCSPSSKNTRYFSEPWPWSSAALTHNVVCQYLLSLSGANVVCSLAREHVTHFLGARLSPLTEYMTLQLRNIHYSIPAHATET